MSTIILVAGPVPVSSGQAAALRASTGLGVSEVRRRIEAGLPLIERELFGLDHEAAAAALSGALKVLASAGVLFAIYEVEAGEALEAAPLDACRVDVATLRNILARA